MIVNANIAIHALTEITAGNESFIYSRGDGVHCWYEIAGVPSCGVGKALAYLGMSGDELTYMDNGVALGILTVELPSGWYLTTYARDVFTAFQEAQDTGSTWGQALEDAQARYIDPSFAVIGY